MKLLWLRLGCFAKSHDKSTVMEGTSAFHSVRLRWIWNVNVDTLADIVNDITNHCMRVNVISTFYNISQLSTSY